jgi:nucleotide-binding universal stress UspA family protein
MATTHAPTAGPAPPAPQPSALRRILCTIDFSQASVAAVAEAVSLARACRGEITVLFVIPYAAPSRSDRPKVPSGVSSAVTEDVEALLEPARAAGIPVRVCLKAGRPAHEILETVRRNAPDVIVMGTHGRGGFKRWALGSVADEVLRNAACPVLTIRHRPQEGAAPASARSGAVVCAVSLSPSSPRTIAHACEVARATGAGLILLHVLEDRATDMREARRRLHELATAHEPPPGDRIEEVVVAGVPAREILRMAAARRAALVVVGGESLSERARSGSTADQVIRRAACAVLTVRSAPEVA